MRLLGVGAVGLAAAVLVGVVSVALAWWWRARSWRGEPVVGVSGPDYARRLVAGTGYSVRKDALSDFSFCDHRRKVVVLAPQCWGNRLRCVLVAAHEAGHARLDGGLPAWLPVPWAGAAVAAVWLVTVLLGGWLRAPGLAAVAVGGSLALVSERARREVRACLFARSAVGRDFADAECRAWSAAWARVEVCCVALESLALALLFLSAAAVLYALVSGGVGWNE